MASPDLGKMVGPLPLGAWVAVVAGGLGFAFYTRRQTATNAAPAVVEDTSAVPGVGTGGSGMWTDLTPPALGSSANQDVAPAITTNDEWGRAAINWLIGMGYNPATSDSAIRKYLGMESLSASEFALVTAAIGHLGATPQLLPPPIFAPPTVQPDPPPEDNTPPPVVNNPPPVVTPPPPKPTIRYYTVVRGDTLWGISRRYYGNGIYYPRIYNANRSGTRRADGTMGMISNPNLIYPGWKLIIP